MDLIGSNDEDAMDVDNDEPANMVRFIIFYIHTNYTLSTLI